MRVLKVVLTVLLAAFAGLSDASAAGLAELGGGLSGPGSFMTESRPKGAHPAEPAGPFYEGKSVVRVDVEGMKAVKLETIVAALQTRVGDPASAASIRQDVKNIWAQGFYDDVRVEAEPAAGGVRLVYHVVERPSIRDVQLDGLSKEIKEKELRDAIDVKAGSVYTKRTQEDAKRKILKFVRDKGWYAAQVEEQSFNHESDHSIILRFKLDLGPKVKVLKINIVGNKFVKDTALKTEMETKPYLFLLQEGIFKEETWTSDMEKVVKHYKSQGFLDAKILPPTFPDNVRYDKSREFMTLYVHVSEGGRYKVRDVSFQLADPTILSEKELLLRCRTRPGTFFHMDFWEEDFQRLRLAYADRGYIYSQLDPPDPAKALTFHPEDQSVSIKVNVTEGPAARIAWIKLAGNESTKDDVVLREVMLNDRGVAGKDGKPTGKGDIFDVTRLRRSQERLLNLGYFDEVTPDTERSEFPGEENLIFTVKERKTGTISVGGGYSSRDKLLFYSQVAENNLFGNGQRVSAEWQVGKNLNTWTLGFFEPWLFPKEPVPLDRAGHRDMGKASMPRPLEPTSFAVDLWHRKSGIFQGHTFDELTTGSSVTLGRAFGQWVQARLTYKYEHTDIRPSSSFQLPIGTKPGFFNTSSAIFYFGYDTRDNIFQPSHGMSAGVTAQVSGGVMRGDKDFVKAIFDTSKHITLLSSLGDGKPLLVLSLHGRVGWTKPSIYPHSQGTNETTGQRNLWDYVLSSRDTVKANDAKDVPYGDLYSVGGIDTVRGYGESELFAEAGKPGFQAFPYLRRQTMILVNAELHFPIADPFRGILFMDMGRAAGKFGNDPVWWQPNTWLDRYTDYYQRDNGPPPPHIPFGISWGPGLRIVIPGTMMLIRFDYGFPIRNGYTFREMLKAGNPAFSIGNLF